jgi:hypothetical protein
VNGSPGVLYGNDYLVPLIGGSGGGGLYSTNSNRGVGGGGGGAILIAASGTVALNGQILSRGGWGDYDCCTTYFGSAGSGGGCSTCGISNYR